MQVSTVLASCLGGLLDTISDDAVDVCEDDILGGEDRLSFERQEAVRFRKTGSWVSAACTADKMLSLSLSILHSLSVMGAFFASARRYTSDVSMSILTLVDHAQSPAVTSLRRCISVLSDQDHEFWNPLVGAGRRWSEDCVRMAAAPMLLTVGSLYRRFVARLDTWPWRLGFLLVGSSPAEKLAIVRELQSRGECCLDSFSLKVKAMCVGIESADPLPHHLVQFVSDVFKNIAVTNIRSEFFFASAKTRAASSHGNAPGPTTIASEHMLAESKSVLKHAILCGT